MKVLNVNTPDFYNQTIDIQITVGELLMLKTAMGKSNSNKFAENVEDGHEDFAEKVVEEELTFVLYDDLKALLNKVSKGR